MCAVADGPIQMNIQPSAPDAGGQTGHVDTPSMGTSRAFRSAFKNHDTTFSFWALVRLHVLQHDLTASVRLCKGVETAMTDD